MVSLMRDYRAGRRQLFALARKPGPAPDTAPARDRVRGRVIALRREGLSVYEISVRLAAEGSPAERHECRGDPHRGRVQPPAADPAAEASTASATPGRDTNLPPSPRWTSPS